MVCQVVERRVAARDVAEHEDPVGMRLLEHRPVDRGDVRAPVDVAEEQAVAALPGDIIDAAQDLDVERVADVPDDDAEQRAPAAPQGSCQEVRLVAEIGCRSQDARAGLVPDRDTGVLIVEDPRDRRDGDAGPLRNVAERDRLANRLDHAPSPPLDMRTMVPMKRKRQGLSLNLTRIVGRTHARRSGGRVSALRSDAAVRVAAREPGCGTAMPTPRREAPVTAVELRPQTVDAGFPTVFGRELIAGAAELRPPPLCRRDDGRPVARARAPLRRPSRRRPRGHDDRGRGAR